jgi:hypothetical protein
MGLGASGASWSAVTWLSSCLYTVWASVIVLCGNAVIVKMPNTFTNERHAHVHLVYSSCNGNDRDTVVEYRWLHWIPHWRTFENIEQKFEGDWFIPTSDSRTWTITLWRWCSGSSTVKPKYKYMQNFQDNWCITDRYGEFFTVMISICITSREYNASYQEITQTVYDFVNGYNHSYTFCSRRRLNLPGMVLPPAQGICTLGHTKIHMR